MTTRNPDGTVNPPGTGTIPFRFHVYWAGSDEDGTIAGYYYAVVETVTTPGFPRSPLPGPKPQDYRFTSRSDTTLIFNVFEQSRVREHAFFIYAVDNNGKPDPTPARFIFNSTDNFPPVPILTVSTATGQVFDINNPNAPAVTRVFTISDTFLVSKPNPADTVPSGSALRFKWRDEETVTDNPAVLFRYKLDEPEFIEVLSTVDSVLYPAGQTGVGKKIFEVRGVDQAGGARTNVSTNRYFLVNFSPDTWFSGPDPSAPGWQSFSDEMHPRPQLYRDQNWNPGLVTPIPGSLFGPDSVQVLPKNRPQVRTFLEIYKNRMWLRAENDTVNQNSFVMFFGGGFDADSPYDVRVNGFALDSTSGPVLQRRPANGSPVGFRLFMPVNLYPVGPVSFFPLSQVFPLDEALTVPEPHIAGYLPVQQTGRAYALLRAVDGNGAVDNRIPSPKAFVDSVDAGLMPSERLPLRSRILTFYVGHAPYLVTSSPAFRPNTAFPPATRTINLNLLAGDDDPYDQSFTPGGPPATSPTPPRFNFTVTLKGVTAAGNDTTYVPSVPGYFRADSPPGTISVPSYMAGTSVSVEIELCDYPDNSFVPGDGRCRYYSFPVVVPPPPTAPPGSSASSSAVSRPGNSDTGSGGKTR